MAKKKNKFSDDGLRDSGSYHDFSCSQRGITIDDDDQKSKGRGGHYIDSEYHLPLEDFVGSHLGRALLGLLSKDRPNGVLLERMISSYADPEISVSERILFWPMHALIRRLKGSATDEFFRWKVAEHSSTVRGIVATARSVAHFGLTLPQKFVVPLIVVWNFTNQCNLRCRHCYQSAEPHPEANELSLPEKFRIVDELGRGYCLCRRRADHQQRLDTSAGALSALWHSHYGGN